MGMTNANVPATTPSVVLICDQLGRKAMSHALGVRPSAISNAVAENCFPSKWYLVVKGLCEQRGLECPDDLFAFATPSLIRTDSTTDQSPDAEDAA